MLKGARELAQRVARLRFAAPVSHTYNPLAYAWAAHELYLSRYGAGPKEVLLVGMNPGPFGMVQTGVPFGEIEMVRDWLGIQAPVEKPAREHPRRPIEGFACRRREVSGARLWGWARDTFGAPKRFFERFFVANYCPLAFLEASGRNLTPDKLPRTEALSLYEACDAALREFVDIWRPRVVVGVGAFAEARARAALAGRDCVIGRVLHPSPASPAANRDWPAQAAAQLRELGVRL